MAVTQRPVIQRVVVAPSACQSVPGQDTEPQISPSGCLFVVCECVCVCSRWAGWHFVLKPLPLVHECVWTGECWLWVVEKTRQVLHECSPFTKQEIGKRPLGLWKLGPRQVFKERQNLSKNAKHSVVPACQRKGFQVPYFMPRQLEYFWILEKHWHNSFLMFLTFYTLNNNENKPYLQL